MSNARTSPGRVGAGESAPRKQGRSLTALGYTKPQTYEELRAVLSSGTVHFPKRLRQVAIFLWQHPSAVALGTIAQVADQAGVQPSTLVRFAQIFGYAGFSDFQGLFKDHMKGSWPDGRGQGSHEPAKEQSANLHFLHGMVGASQASLSRIGSGFDTDSFEKMVDLLAGAELIYVIGSKRAFPVTTYVSLTLSQQGVRNVLVDNVGSTAFDQVGCISRRDAVLAVSFSPYNSITPDLVAVAHERGASIVAITDSTFSPLVKLSDTWLEVVESDFAGFRSLAASLAVGMALVHGVVARRTGRATVLRDGATVGVVDIEPGIEEKIVEMMLGARIEKTSVAAARVASQGSAAQDSHPRLSVRNLQLGTKLHDVSFDLANGEVAGVVALEGQGQDELFAALAGSIRPAGGTIAVDGAPVKFSHPSDAIQAGIAYVPGDRTEALAMQRSVRENIALPFSAALRKWGPIRVQRERMVVSSAIARLQIDTRAQGEVQRLSGGNQQKVTIARWIAADARTILCFDPTRGIDVGTKQEIYKLLRELAGLGKSVLFYTSELEEVQRVCDRVIVIFGGRVVDTFPVELADEPALMRAAYGLPRGAREDVGILADVRPTPDAEAAS